jgi:hypothetical protein
MIKYEAESIKLMNSSMQRKTLYAIFNLETEIRRSLKANKRNRSHTKSGLSKYREPNGIKLQNKKT